MLGEKVWSQKLFGSQKCLIQKSLGIRNLDLIDSNPKKSKLNTFVKKNYKDRIYFQKSFFIKKCVQSLYSQKDIW